MPSPFVIPGVSLEEVLGACKAPHGRRLFRLVEAANRDLADYVRERRDDGDLEPVELGEGPAADPPSAAGPSTSPSTPRSTAELEALLTDRGRDVLAALRLVAGEWRAPRELAELLELKADLLSGPIRDLRLAGLIEHNGKLRTASRVRVPPPGRLYVGRESTPGPATAPDVTFPVGDPETMPVDLDDEDDDGPGDGDYSTHPAGTGPPPIPPGARWEGGVAAKAGPPAPAVSRRVRRELEAEEKRKAALAGSDPPPAATNGAGTLDGQALQRLTLFPSTIPELATALGCHRAEAAAAIRRLEDDGDLDRRGKRSGEIVYGAHL